ncbi:MAG: hypothetical protein JO249_11790 [Acidobacteria bacterium]|nr:hypothetical protein [Acidobacteriota bacterium]
MPEERAGEFSGLSQRTTLSLEMPIYEGNSRDTLQDTVASDDPSGEEIVYPRQRKHVILKYLKSLGERDSTIMQDYYGIEREEPLTFREVGDLHGLKKQRIQQIDKEARRRLKKISELKALHDDL